MQGVDGEKKEKIGIFGGTFDPVHKGHVRLATFVLEQRVVDRVVYVPAAQPPHKSGAAASFSHRLAMLEIAISGRSTMSVSDIETHRNGPSYTVDSLRALQHEFPESRLFFLLGADSLLDLHHWSRFPELFNLAELIVVARTGLADTLCHQAIRKLPGEFIPDSANRTWRRNDGARIWYLTGFASDISSSSVRHQLENRQQPMDVDPAVFDHIVQHRLYQRREESELYS